MDLKLPPLGEGVDSGTVVGILVKEGDQVNKGQDIIELETGKLETTLEAGAAMTALEGGAGSIEGNYVQD